MDLISWLSLGCREVARIKANAGEAGRPRQYGDCHNAGNDARITLEVSSELKRSVDRLRFEDAASSQRYAFDIYIPQSMT